MAKRMSEEDLQKMGLQDNGDGTYSKKKTVKQPREFKNDLDPNLYKGTHKLTGTAKVITHKTGDVYTFHTVPYPPFNGPMFRKITLTLFGEPMAKQSVRATKSGDFFQPKKTTDRVKDYQKQIRDQLPKDFVMFETCVFVRKMHFLYAPLKAFHKEKGKMEAIRNGKKYYKNTRPDLPDNMKKLVNDAMSELVYKDDSIIVSEDDVKKYYSVGGCVIIVLEGY